MIVGPEKKHCLSGRLSLFGFWVPGLTLLFVFKEAVGNEPVVRAPPLSRGALLGFKGGKQQHRWWSGGPEGSPDFSTPILGLETAHHDTTELVSRVGVERNVQSVNSLECGALRGVELKILQVFLPLL